MTVPVCYSDFRKSRTVSSFYTGKKEQFYKFILKIFFHVPNKQLSFNDIDCLLLQNNSKRRGVLFTEVGPLRTTPLGCM